MSMTLLIAAIVLLVILMWRGRNDRWGKEAK